MNNIDNMGKKKRSFKSVGRIILILFMGLSMYLFVSTIILMFLTKSEKEVIVPYVVGKQFVEVYNSLIRKGFIPDIKIYDVSDIDNGVILDQHPDKGSIVPEGEKIKLIVSRSKVLIPVPNLIGSKLPFAMNKLKNLHINDRSYALDVGVISYIPSDNVAGSIVIDHNPEAGEEVSPERKINLLVSAGKVSDNMRMPRVTGQAINLGFDLLLSKGLTIAEEIVLTDSKWKTGRIESQNIDRGEEVKKGKLVRLKVNYFPHKEHPYTSYERVTYVIPADQKKGLYEAYVEDSRSKRIRYSRIMKPGWKIDFIFKRKGNAKIRITRDKKVIEVIGIDVDEY